ncbi:MAG: ABA4-like family protein [Pseudomonadota bacterium]
MNYENLFSLLGVTAMLGWLLLLISPLTPKWSDRIAGRVIPACFAVIYVWTAFTANEVRGGFSSFADIRLLFGHDAALMSGWIHMLSFDLVVGAWICRTARDAGIRFRFVVPTLALTFLFGPAGVPCVFADHRRFPAP